MTPKPAIAEGIAISRPMRGKTILELCRKYQVQFVTAPENEILQARQELAAKGIYCEHTTAANYAGYKNYCRTHGEISDCPAGSLRAQPDIATVVFIMQFPVSGLEKESGCVFRTHDSLTKQTSQRHSF